MAKARSPFEINPDELDQEWLRQAPLMRKAGLEEADARLGHAQAKARLDVTEARLKLKIRQNPDLYGLLDEKVTVSEVTAAMIMSEEYQKAVAAVDQAKYALDIATAETTAMVDRRKALERLVELLGLNYWSEREPRAVTEEAQDRMKASRRRATYGGSSDV